jgi:DNA-directed RNA polymerase
MNLSLPATGGGLDSYDDEVKFSRHRESLEEVVGATQTIDDVYADGAWSSADAVSDPPDDLEEGWLDSPNYTLAEKEKWLELGAVQIAVSRYRKMLKAMETIGLASSLQPAQKQVLDWYAPLVSAIRGEIESIYSLADVSDGSKSFRPYLSRVKAEVLAVVTLHEVLGATLRSYPEGAAFGETALAVGTAVQAQVNIDRLKDEEPRMYAYYQKSSKKSVSQINRRSRVLDEGVWPRSVRVQLGSRLVELLLATAEIDRPLDDPAGLFGSAGADAADSSGPRRALERGDIGAERSWPSSADDADALGLGARTRGNIQPAPPSAYASVASSSSAARRSVDGGLSLFECLLREIEEPAASGGSGGGFERVPAFTHAIEHTAKLKKRGVLRCSPEVIDRVRAGHNYLESLHTRFQPMVMPPLEWRSPTVGGYRYNTSDGASHGHGVRVLRTSGSALQASVLEEPSTDLSTLYRGLNVLSALPWRINKSVLATVDETWAQGGNLAEVPSRVDTAEPEEPVFADMTDEEVAASAEAKARRADYFRQRARVRRANGDAHSLRCSFQYQLQVAHQFASQERIYFPSNVDFRGRAYPLPPHLNHMGSDLCRSLLTFAEARPLGDRGLYWLKVHLCNLFGMNKMSFAERVHFVDERIDQVLDSAERPLEGSRWWTEADEPWQALATCAELRNALESGNPTTYESRLPVHTDGSCNGLQHYAALGGDEFGARQVNLAPATRPQDVYSGVADLVIARVAQDGAAGVAEAKLVDGKINRKIVKQTVMTSVYGVTRVGARAQIENAMRDQERISDDDVWAASNYVAALTFDALREMFTGARTIMDWLANCARIIASQAEPVTWTSPIGLPVVQPYRRPGLQRIRTVVQDVLLTKNDHLPVSVARQRSAFPPNYVHSLDSTHMFFTALAMDHAGLPYASVHDSFWAHACNIDTMGRLLRQQFVRLHSQPLLQDLHTHFCRTHPTLDFPPPPPRGDFELQNVLRSPYFFH